MRTALTLASFVVTAILLSGSAADAAQKTIPPLRDNTIYQESDTTSNGAGEYLFSGLTGIGVKRRALISFAVADSILAGAVIDSVVLTLNMSRTLNGSQPVSLHRLNADWGAKTSNALGNEGSGAPADTGDATWSHAFWPTTAWTAGGDYVAAASATQTVIGIAVYKWTSAQMAADVQGWLDNPSTNYGWIIVSNESSFPSTKRFDSGDNLVPSARPQLEVWYSSPPTAVSDRPVRGTSLMLYASVPNPFNPTTTISFETFDAGNARVTIHDARGARVTTLHDGLLTASRHSLTWNGRGGNGQALSSGVYFVRVAFRGETLTQKITMVK